MTTPTETSGINDVDNKEEPEPDEPGSQTPRKITFPVESILNAVIQDGDVIELFSILCHRLSEININQRNHSGLTALHYAVLTNNLDSVKLLINHGADVRVQDVYGFSPLHTAAALGYLHITALLIVFGADVFSLTNQSELPVDLAKDISVIRLLSKEMYHHLHREHYFRSLVTYHLKRTSRYTFQCVLCLCKAVLLILQHIFIKSSGYLGPYINGYARTFIKRRRRSIVNGKSKETKETREPRSRKPSTNDLELPSDTINKHISLKQD